VSFSNGVRPARKSPPPDSGDRQTVRVDLEAEVGDAA